MANISDDEEFEAWVEQCDENKKWWRRRYDDDEWVERYGPAVIELCQGFIDDNAFGKFFATPEGRRMQRDSERWYAKHAKHAKRLKQLSRPRRGEPKPSLAAALREAKKANVAVAGATIEAGKVALTFGEAAKTDSNELDQWMEKHKNQAARGRHAPDLPVRLERRAVIRGEPGTPNFRRWKVEPCGGRNHNNSPN